VCGFIHNDIVDYPYDSLDPAKQHFPLISKAIDFRKADEINRAAMILFCFYAAYLTKLQPIPTFLFIIAIISGLLYDYYSKVTSITIFGVSTAWGILPLISYYSTTSVFSPVIFALTLYSWVQVYVQIAVLGFIKDMQAPRQNNLMRKLGCRLEGNELICSKRAHAFAITLKTFHSVLLFPVLILAGLTSPSAPAAWLSLILLGLSYKPYLGLLNRKWERDKVLGRCVLNEALCFLASIAAIQGVIGWETTLFMLVYPPIWVFVWMRLQWGTWRVGPKV
jgi:4-hydroxybenzoate polyprenyltransferase